ncbi:MAG: hypothetical protein IJL78_00880 [Lachnospiraceae bacterium]|nr:hypothetical protein [Lachnospiraceae bacterium]
MSILLQLQDPAEWEAFFLYKEEKRHLTREEACDLRAFIDNQEYLPVVSRILSGGTFSVPEKKLIRKMDTDKKRAVYVFPREENYVLKLLTFLLLRKYDGLFTDDLYSFRVSRGAGKALTRVLHMPGLRSMYVYKVDISNYFNSIDVPEMLVMLTDVFRDDPQLYELFEKLLTDPRVCDQGVVTEEKKGVMAGTPFAVFLANLYLLPLDKRMQAEGFLYARYSDDIILFAPTEAARERGAEIILETLHAHGLSVNPEKEHRASSGEPWTFLGVSYDGGTVDISPVSKEKLKARIRRKSRALRRWQIRKGATDEQAAKALVRSMNRKYFSADSSHELTWTRWYFPLITTDRTLHELDLYLQDWIRYLASGGHHRKQNYAFRYEDLKALGYRSLVHEWYEKDAP